MNYLVCFFYFFLFRLFTFDLKLRRLRSFYPRCPLPYQHAYSVVKSSRTTTSSRRTHRLFLSSPRRSPSRRRKEASSYGLLLVDDTKGVSSSRRAVSSRRFESFLLILPSGQYSSKNSDNLTVMLL